MLRRKIWITWEDQRRNRELAKSVGARLYELKDIDQISNRLVKYFFGIIKTFRILFNNKPNIVFAQNPSIVLSFLLVFLKKIFKYTLVVDAHNAGIYPAEGESKLLMSVSRYIQRKADMVLITNGELSQEVLKNHGTPHILPDKFPTILGNDTYDLSSDYFNVIFICTYAIDEPYVEVIQSGNYINENIRIYITGNYKKVGISSEELPSNVILTGYLSLEDFESLLVSCDGVIDLTERESCLVCGAYEAVSAEKPMILSDTKALREYFYKGAVYSKHDPKSLANSINYLERNHTSLKEEVKSLKTEREVYWQTQLEQLIKKLSH